ncbi:hypothetical protein [Adhaeribacter pallidiroseus]|uniref:Uncharacterized protein n=1 Tax=Adhaeribacter pallidiroseus TaxID=2072847 RepID=A0A369Q6Q9_9BACT|nr:hypothetical protein [Adhaeribacter pallidiroseus]RDC58816.1 hypothetical protein AHMF7616_05250 [Adhaeribacter pallidiroseus]
MQKSGILPAKHHVPRYARGTIAPTRKRLSEAPDPRKGGQNRSASAVIYLVWPRFLPPPGCYHCEDFYQGKGGEGGRLGAGWGPAGTVRARGRKGFSGQSATF